MEKRLNLFPTPIADNDLKYSIPEVNLELLNHCDCFIVEDLRSARRFLKKAGYKKDFEEVEFFILNEHTKVEEIEDYLDPIKKWEEHWFDVRGWTSLYCRSWSNGC